MSTIAFEIRQAVARLRSEPGITALAMIVLGLGVGANAAMFSVAFAVVVRPLPYPEPQQIVRVFPRTSTNKALVHALQHTSAFASVSGYAESRTAVVAADEPSLVRGAMVEARFFETLGARAALGRVLVAADGEPDRERVAVISDGLWRRRFGGDPAAVGRAVLVNGRPHTIVGVLPATHASLAPGWEIWTPLVIDTRDDQDFLGSFYVDPIARLRPGVSVDAAAAEVRRALADLRQRYPNVFTDPKLDGAAIEPLQRHLVGDVERMLWSLVAAAAIVLLVACADVANLLLVRTVARRRDMAVRLALGATVPRLMGMVLAEGLVLGLAGGVIGAAAGAALFRALVLVLPASLPLADTVSFDATAFAAAWGAALLATVAAALFPASLARRTDALAELKAEGEASLGSGRGRRLTAAFCVVQLAAMMVLLFGSGVAAQSLWQLRRTPTGIDPTGLFTFRIDPPSAVYSTPAAQSEYLDRVLSRLRQLPGITQAGAIHLLPLGEGHWSFPYVAEDGPAAPAGALVTLPQASFRVVTPGYFEAAGVRLIEGRAFDAGDDGASESVGIVNRTMANELWRGTTALGKTIQLFGDGGPSFQVVGVVDDVRQRRVDEAASPEMYRPYAQWPVESTYVLLRTPAPPEELPASIQRAVWSIDRRVPVSEVRPMRDVVSASLDEERYVTGLLLSFTVVAVLLGMTGVYGVVSYSVVKRSRELALRVALGATPLHIVRLVLGGAMTLAALGIAVGTAITLFAADVVDLRRYRVPSRDVRTLLLAAALVAVAALVSALLPAIRATRAGGQGTAPARHRVERRAA